MQDLWLLHLNPFFWECVVFMVWGVVTGLVVNALTGFPKRLLESL